MPPPKKRRQRSSTPVITICFWLVVIALAATGFVYGKRIWPSLFKAQQVEQDSKNYVSVTCDTCKGRRRCLTCKGSGKAMGLNDTRKKQTLGQMNCRACGGTRMCSQCNGKGAVQQRVH